ncbi:hypothetical protein [Arthrobacter luteolus]|uniref:hypothetical protein n=1 Tax=Arthrobacter luteolus TaxID=98672 RepID=UPI000A88D154|nr:hypothetical protein [Arthrobacter luteolus]
MAIGTSQANPSEAPSSIPLTNGEIVWTDDASGAAQAVLIDYSAALRKRAEEHAQLNLSASVSTHYVDTAAKQLRLKSNKRKGAALFANLGSLAAGGGLSAFVATLMTPSPDAVVISFSTFFLVAGAAAVVFGSTDSNK